MSPRILRFFCATASSSRASTSGSICFKASGRRARLSGSSSMNSRTNCSSPPTLFSDFALPSSCWAASDARMPMGAYSWAGYCDWTLVENRQCSLKTPASKRPAAQRLHTSSMSRSPSPSTKRLDESLRDSPVSHLEHEAGDGAAGVAGVGDRDGRPGGAVAAQVHHPAGGAVAALAPGAAHVFVDGAAACAGSGGGVVAGGVEVAPVERQEAERNRVQQ